MSLSMHKACVPAILQHLNSLSAILDKAAAHCETRKIDPTLLINYRLAPDMHPLARQIQIMTDLAKGMAARLAGVEVPSYEDTEVSFEELKARIAKTIAFVTGFTPAQFEGAEDRAIILKTPRRELTFDGASYLFGFALPNFYFHATTAYDILRHAGIELGKMDFLGALPTR